MINWVFPGGRKRPLVRTRLDIELLEDRIVPSGTPPTAVADFYAVHQGKMLTAQPLVNDTDLEDTTLIPTITTNGSNGYAYFDGAGILYYAPYAGYAGTDTLSYRVSDGTSDSNIVDIAIIVTNTPPVAVDDEYSVHQGESITVTPLMSATICRESTFVLLRAPLEFPLLVTAVRLMLFVFDVTYFTTMT